jgi:dihydrodipicolinate reductase
MQLTKSQTQHLNKTDINPVCTGFNEKQYLRYRALEEKIGARLHSSKMSLDFNMIEEFYAQLLPVTYREWICR